MRFYHCLLSFNLPQRNNPIQQLSGNLLFTHLFQLFNLTIRRQKLDYIGISIKPCTLPGNIISNNQIEIFLLQFLRSMNQQSLGFSSKSNQNQLPLSFAPVQPRYRDFSLISESIYQQFFSFFVRSVNRSIVGNSSGFDHHIDIIEMGKYRSTHLICRKDRHTTSPRPEQLDLLARQSGSPVHRAAEPLQQWQIPFFRKSN